MEKLREIFDEKTSLINLEDIELTAIDELELIANELDHNKKIHYVNWKNNQSILDKNSEIKTRIQTRLVSNFLNEKKTDLVIDLSEFQIDHDYLTILSQAISNKTQTVVGQVILGEQNEALNESKEWSQLLSSLSENNRNFQRYPSDIVHCMLSTYFQHPPDSDIFSSLEQLGWDIENEFKIPDQNYSLDNRRQHIH